MTGDGTEESPYIISSLADLDDVRNDLAAYYELSADIDASATSGWNGGKGFEPIGGWTNYGIVVPDPPYVGCSGTYYQLGMFTGHFDGRNYVIKDITINWDLASTVCPYYLYVGLFNYLGYGAVVQNLRISGANVDAEDYAGVLVGFATGATIYNCRVGGTVDGDDRLGGLIGYISSNTTIEYCGSTADVTAGGAYGGGFAAYSYNSSISKCFAKGDVAVTGDWAGGFIGMDYGTDIDDCFAHGAVSGDDSVGGFIGNITDATTTVDNVYSKGAVSGTTNLGGLVGYKDAGATVTNSFWDTQTSGQAASAGGTGKTTALMTVDDTFTDAGWDFDDIWTRLNNVNDGYPYLQGNPITIDPIYMTLLKIRGKNIIPSATLDIIVEDTDSQDKYGKRSLSLTGEITPYKTALKTMMEDILDENKAPRVTNLEITLRNRDVDMWEQMLLRDISDRVTVVHTDLGINDDYFINKIEHQVSTAGKLHEVKWTLEKA